MADNHDFDVRVESAKPDNTWTDREQRILAVADRLDEKLGLRFWTLAGLLVASLIFGTPHLLILYQCSGRCSQYANEFNCQYLGIRGWKSTDSDQGKCPRVRLL